METLHPCRINMKRKHASKACFCEKVLCNNSSKDASRQTHSCLIYGACHAMAWATTCTFICIDCFISHRKLMYASEERKNQPLSCLCKYMRNNCAEVFSFGNHLFLSYLNNSIFNIITQREVWTMVCDR